MPQVYRIALYDNEKDGIPKPIEVTWAELCKELSNVEVTPCDPCPGHSCSRKKGAAWSPVDFAAGAQSRSEGRAVTLAVFDLDAPTEAELETLANVLQGYRFAFHSTHTAGSYRLVLPLSRPCPAARWRDVWPALVRRLGVNLWTPEKPHGIDSKCSDVPRLYFFPSCPASRAHEFEFISGEGADTDIPEFLEPDARGTAGTPAVSREATGDVVDRGSAPDGPIDLAAVRAELRALKRPDSAVLVKRCLNGEPIAREGERDENIHALASILAATPRQALPVQVAMQLMRPCIAAMPTEPEGLESWLTKAQFSYERALERRAERDAVAAQTKQLMARVLGRRDPAAPPSAEPDNPDDEWRQHLLVRVDRDGQPIGLQGAGVNAGLILDNSPEFKDKIRFNLLTKEIECDGLLPATAPVEIANWLALSEYKLTLPTPWVGEQLLATARHHDYNPVKEYLRKLPQWDGQRRCQDNFLFRYFGVVGDGSDRMQKHHRRIGLLWLIGLVARGLDPGCFVKNVLILHGDQNVGKSLALRALGGEWFSDTKLDLSSKDARMAVSRFWLIELAELTSLRQADNETIKNFLSQRSDDYRPPYGHALETFPRSCIFVGTTNRDEFLTDPTGNSRFWPVHVNNPHYNELKIDRDQIFAEAVQLYDGGHPWWLDEEETKQAEVYAREFTNVQAKAEPILAWLLALEPGKRLEYYSTMDIATQALGYLKSQVTQSVAIEIGTAMRQLGFGKKRLRSGGVPTWFYETPKMILNAARERIRPVASPMVDAVEADIPLKERTDVPSKP